MSAEQMRTAFEQWYSNNGKFPKTVERSGDDSYVYMGAHSAWTAWQAALATQPQAPFENIEATENALALDGMDRWIQTAKKLAKEVTNMQLLIDQVSRNDRINKQGWMNLEACREGLVKAEIALSNHYDSIRHGG